MPSRGLNWVTVRVTNCASLLGLGGSQDIGLLILKLGKDPRQTGVSCSPQ